MKSSDLCRICKNSTPLRAGLCSNCAGNAIILGPMEQGRALVGNLLFIISQNVREHDLTEAEIDLIDEADEFLERKCRKHKTDKMDDGICDSCLAAEARS